MHSAQYLWITITMRGAKLWRRRSVASNRLFCIQIVAVLPYLCRGRGWQALSSLRSPASFLIFTALVNLHHFILDGAIWKLRDGQIAALLLNTQERILPPRGGRQVQRPAWPGCEVRHWFPPPSEIATAIFY